MSLLKNASREHKLAVRLLLQLEPSLAYSRYLSNGAASEFQQEPNTPSAAKKHLGPVTRKTLRRKPNPDPLLPPPPASSFPPLTAKDYFRFEVVHRSSKSAARVGRIHTPHGIIDTPGYVAVGTNAALKAVDASWADAEGLELMFANTYHLILHPGTEVVHNAGGLHAFMGRHRPLITDSGGFQVFSLAHGTVHEELNSIKRATRGSSETSNTSLVTKVREEGVTFRSYRDGTLLQLTPESSVHAQKDLGADIILPLDELPPYHVTDKTLTASVARSHRWMARSLHAHLDDPRLQAMYGIIHGGTSLELRQQSIAYMTSLPFDGFAIGGALGKDREELGWLMGHIMPMMPGDHRPVHVLGIADPVNIKELTPLGCDTFDSCHATRVGRHGAMLRREGPPIRVLAAENKTAYRSPVEGCKCHTCRSHTLAYLHHLLKAREPLAASLLSIHNIRVMCDIMSDLRLKILADEI